MTSLLGSLTLFWEACRHAGRQACRQAGMQSVQIMARGYSIEAVHKAVELEEER